MTPKIIYLILMLISMPVSAQNFGNTRITPENAAEVTLMATYEHNAPPVVAWSPDGRFLAIAQAMPDGEASAPGRAGDLSLYQRNQEQSYRGAVMVYDMRNLTEEPTVLSENILWVKKMVFTDDRLLVLAQIPNDTYPHLLEWRIEGTVFTASTPITLILEDSFAIDPEAGTIGYFIGGGTYIFEQNSASRRRVGSEGTYPLGLSAIDAAEGYFAYAGADIITVRTNEDGPETYASFPITATPDGPVFQMTASGLYFEEQDKIWYWPNEGGVLNGIAPQVVLQTPLTDFAISPDERLIATITSIEPLGSALLLWDNRAPGTIKPYLMRWNRPDIDEVHFNPGGTRLLTIADAKIELWSLPENLPSPAQARALSAYNVLAYCGETIQQASTKNDMGLVWSWFASDETGIREHLDAANYTITIDEQVLYHWTFITRIIDDPVNDNDPTVYFYTPIGDALSIGTHRVGYELAWTRVISDGYTSYGSGTDNPLETGQCTIEITD